ncbi:MAG: CoB--CoM heterodisulfide reductase iron-sulfur subunit B family protein [Anaerolineales bacterium]|nr:CoB--CoM heterodisulfide reductase iron-sulfur subunit B family protein [Anaerolineales bacterium]
MPKYIFYPGCSMERSARPYLDSTLAIQETLGIQLEEVPDWNCCGATEYAASHLLPSYALVGRNLALAAKQTNGTRTLVAGCSACYLNLAKTDHYMRHDAQLADRVNTALTAGGLQYQAGSVTVRHLLDVLINDIGLDRIRSKVVRPLKGLRVAAYYGCQVPRPDYDRRFHNHEYPNQLEQIIKALGATVIDFPLKTHCCGGHMTQISEATAYEMIRQLVHGADQYQADLMASLCPMCQLNLDAYQVEMNKFFKTSYHVPTVFFTQLMGLAFGLDAKALGFGKEFVSAAAALAKIGVEAPPAEVDQVPPPAKLPRGKPSGLPMPRMPGQEE